MNRKAILISIFALFCVNAHAADNKISELTDATAVTSDDLSVIVDDPAGTAATKKITWANAAGSAPFSSLYQATDADLTTYAGITPSANVQTLLSSASFAAFRTSLSLVIGTNVQAWDSDLDAFALETAPTGVVVGTTDTQTLSNKTITLPLIDNGATSAGYIEVREDTDNGSNYIRIAGVDSVVTNRTLTLPDATDTLVGKDTTDTLTNKSISGGQITSAVATATALAANGANASSGNAILGVDASGAAEGAFDVWTEAENTSAAYAAQATTMTAGAGLSGGGSLAANRTFATDSTEADFLASGALTCGASTQGKAKVHTTALQYCDNAATPTLQYAAYGSSSGVATSATALAANGSNCSAGSYPLGVDASGAVESCTDATTEIDSALAAFTGSSNIVTLGTIVTGTWNAGAVTSSGKIIGNASLDVKNGATTSGVLAIFEDSDAGTNKATFEVPALAGDTVYVLPADDGDADQVLSTNGSGTLDWVAASVGTGDVTGVGDCADGACYDGTSDGGTYARLYDGDSNYTAIVSSNVAANKTITLPADTGTLATLALAETLTNKTLAAADNVIEADDVSCTNCLTVTEVASADAATNVSDADFGDVTVATGAWAVEDDSHAHTTTTISGLVNADLSGSAGITLANTAITAGRSLTISTNDILADSETYTDTKCIYFENPIATDDFKSIWFAKQAATITSIWAESDQTVTFMLQVDDGTAADVDTVDLAPAAGTAEDTSLDGDATLASGERLDLAVTSVTNTPTWCSICWTFTYDD